MRVLHHLMLVLALCLGSVPLIAAGCDDAGEPSSAEQAADIDGRTIAELEITGDDTTALRVGRATQLRATLRYADGSSRDITADPNLQWNTDNPTIAAVTKTGLVSALRVGLAKITATYRGIVATESLVVLD